jgi:CelD/BcsL family acetyltransferase involved in cellulose biosynthesis
LQEGRIELLNRTPIDLALHQTDALVGGLRLAVFDDIRACRDTWLQLQNDSSCSFFQSYDWCVAWLSTIGRSFAVQLVIVVGLTKDGDVAFILPFQIRRKIGLATLEWLTQPDCTYGMGLNNSRVLDPDWFSQNFSTLLQSLPRHDIVNLNNMPVRLAAVGNPLSSRLRFEAANNSYAMELLPSFEELHVKKRSAKSISKIRRRDERLHDSGKLEFVVERPGRVSQERLAEVILHKNLHLSQRGVGQVFDIDAQNFVQALTQSQQENHGLQVYRLVLNDRTISSAVGAIHNSCFYLMITALAPDAPLHLSPGDLLLRKIIEHTCLIGLKRFDFGKGVEDYKLLWADEEIELYNLLEVRRLKALPYATAALAYGVAKRTIKKNDKLRKLFFEMRALVRGR